MKRNVDISIVVPTYNRSNLLPLLFQNIELQTVKPLEIVIVDDGSDDDTSIRVKKLIDEYPQLSISAYRQANKGVAAARNQGIALAKGRYIAFQDDDDCWHPQKLELQYDTVKKAGAELCFCIQVEVSNRTNPEKYSHIDSVDALFREITIKDILLSKWRGGIQTLLVDTETAKQIEPFKKSLRVAEDTEWMIRLVSSGKSILLDERLVEYVESEGSLSREEGLEAQCKRDIHIVNMIDYLNSFSTTAPTWDEEAFQWRIAREYNWIIKNSLYAGNLETAIDYMKRCESLLLDTSAMSSARRKIRKAKILRIFGKSLKHPKHR